jgi:septum formation protein
MSKRHFPYPIILASTSPRRSKLMQDAHFSFVVKTTEVAEDYPDTLPVDEVASFLAEKKAEASRIFLTSADEIILAADSVVILDEVIYGKPVDRADAQHILRQLSGRMHRVITGVCLLSAQKKRVFSEVANVYVEPMDDEEIDFYIDQFQPFDKAGAYAIQEWIGLCKISKIEGTFSNIMGLPMQAVYRELWDFGRA